MAKKKDTTLKVEGGFNSAGSLREVEVANLCEAVYFFLNPKNCPY